MARPRNIPDVNVKLIDSIFVKTNFGYSSKDIMERLWGAAGLLTTNVAGYESSQTPPVVDNKQESKSEPAQAPKYLITKRGGGDVGTNGSYSPDLVFLGNAMILRPY